MTIQLPGQAAPAAGFDAPLQMLAACHRRVERQCQTIRRLAEYLPARGADERAREAARAVMRYFDVAARDHHADEESDLFPALVATAQQADADRIRKATGTLVEQHRILERRWAALRAELAALAAGDGAALSDDRVQAFLSLYELHIAFEERELLPVAERLLGSAALEGIGRSMRRRRGVREPELAA